MPQAARDAAPLSSAYRAAPTSIAAFRPRLGILWLPLFLALAWNTAAAEVVLVSVEGEEIRGALERLDAAQGITVAGKTFRLEDVAELRFPGISRLGAGDKPGVRLRNGDILSADIRSGDDTALSVQADWLGERKIKNSLLRGIAFPIKKPPANAVLEAFFGGKDPDRDRVLTPKGETLSGFMEKFSGKELVFEIGGQKRTLPFTKIAAFRFAALEKFIPQRGVLALVKLNDGSRLSGRPAGFAGGTISLKSAGGLVYALPVRRILSVEVKGGKLVYLSELRPRRVEQKPLVGGAPVVWTWRSDRSVSGRVLKIGRKEFSRGVGVHSYCKLSYALGGAYRKFLADVGLDASAALGAACSWRVVGDGKELAAGEAKAGGKSQKLNVALSGIQTLSLICDYGADQDDSGDRLDWAGARLVK